MKRGDNGRWVYEAYAKHAMRSSETVETFYPHASPTGRVWLLSHSGAALDSAERWAELREDMIQTYMAVPVELMFGTPPRPHFTYTMGREEAEQKADAVLGIWPTRILCSANPNGYANLCRRFARPLANAA